MKPVVLMLPVSYYLYYLILFDVKQGFSADLMYYVILFFHFFISSRRVGLIEVSGVTGLSSR